MNILYILVIHNYIFILILSSMVYCIGILMHTFMISLFLYRDLICVLRSRPHLNIDRAMLKTIRLYSIHHESLNISSMTPKMYVCIHTHIYIFIFIIS